MVAHPHLQAIPHLEDLKDNQSLKKGAVKRYRFVVVLWKVVVVPKNQNLAGLEENLLANLRVQLVQVNLAGLEDQAARVKLASQLVQLAPAGLDSEVQVKKCLMPKNKRSQNEKLSL